MVNVKRLLEWSEGGPRAEASEPADPAPAMLRALKESPHPGVRGIAKDRSVREGLEGILRARLYYAPARKASDELKPILAQRLDDLARAVARAKKAALAVPRRNTITERWVEALEDIGREAKEFLPIVEPPRRKTKADRDSLIRSVLHVLLYRCDLTLHPLTHEPKGFAAETAAAVCSVAGFTFPNDDKERRQLLERAFVAIQGSDPNIKTAKGRSSSPRRG